MSTKRSTDRVASDLGSAMQDAEELMTATAGQAGDKMKEMRSRLTGALDSAKETYQRLEEKTAAAAKATDETIRDHPYESIGVAFGVGLLIGFLFARK